MLGGFVTYLFFVHWGLLNWLVFLLALMLVALVGIAAQKVIFYPICDRPNLDPLIATFCVMGIIQSVVNMNLQFIPTESEERHETER
jgi:branched-subunit amino acid ABC-type transport system permease component